MPSRMFALVGLVAPSSAVAPMTAPPLDHVMPSEEVAYAMRVLLESLAVYHIFQIASSLITAGSWAAKLSAAPALPCPRTEIGSGTASPSADGSAVSSSYLTQVI